MQQRFGEDSIWVYEIIRYTHTSVMLGVTEYSTEVSISQKVARDVLIPTATNIIALSSERKVDTD